MDRAHIRSVALFFFFALLDEKQALRATFRAVEELKLRAKRVRQSREINNSDVIEVTHHVWELQRRTKSQIVAPDGVVEGWSVSPSLDLGPWRQFRKQSTEQEVLAIIWSQIIGYTESDIAAGLSISIGTVQYRVSNALKVLGTMTPIGGLRA